MAGVGSHLRWSIGSYPIGRNGVSVGRRRRRRAVPDCGRLSGWNTYSGYSTARSWTGADTLMAEGPGKPVIFIQWDGNSAKDLYSRMSGDAVWIQVADSTWNSLYAWYSWDNAYNRGPEQTLVDHEIAHNLMRTSGPSSLPRCWTTRKMGSGSVRRLNIQG